MSLPAVHQHLGVLEEAGLVTCEKRGRERWWRLEPGALDEAASWISERRALWQKRLGALALVLAEERSDKRNRPTKNRRQRK